VQVEVDFSCCESHGECAMTAPEVFELDDNDELQILLPNPPERLRADVEAAARTCPTQAITLRE
jgi:ferredoxin